MTATHQTRRVYSAEELHRLRSSCSQPKLKEAIEERDGEDAELVKEHVLRGSKSFAARSWKSRASTNSSLRAVSNKENQSTVVPKLHIAPIAPHLQPPLLAGLGQVPANHQLKQSHLTSLRRSPTPSLKRQKVESLVKAHGSPTHVRVTAGGRIVPREQSPLCYPRYGYSAIKVNGGLIKFAPNRPMGKMEWTQATQDGFVAQDINGNMCQIVNGTILPLNEINGAVQLYVPAPNLKIQPGSSISGLGPFGGHGIYQPRDLAKHNAPSEPSQTAQANALELEYSKLENELKDIDKTEALHGRSMGKGPKDALVARRRELVTSMDQIRKAIKGLKHQSPTDSFSSTTSPKARSSSPQPSRLPPFLQNRPPNPYSDIPVPPPAVFNHFYVPAHQTSFAGPLPFQGTPVEPSFPGHQWAIAPQYAMGPSPACDGTISTVMLPLPESYDDTVGGGVRDVIEPEQGAAKTPQQEASTATTSQKTASPSRSHAVPIKAPDQKSGATMKSTLNPMSPVYKPCIRALQNDTDKEGIQCRIQPQISPVDSESVQGGTTSSKRGARLHSSSVSSFETADFFPRDTREYSTRQYTRPTSHSHPAKENVGPERTNGVKTSTPDTLDALTNSLKTLDIVNGHDGSSRAPIAPPGTPIDNFVTAGQYQAHDASAWTDASLQAFSTKSVPDREAHNISPKTKRREWLFVQEDPSGERSQTSSSPEQPHACQDKICVTSSPYDTVDFSNKSRDWIEGYQAGLNRRPVPAHRTGEFMDGYCSGLLKGKPIKVTISTGSPVKTISRRPSPAPVVDRSSGNPTGCQAPSQLGLTPVEQTVQSMDTLKQAIIAPHNEDAVLTPAANGPHVNETPFHLGAWTKQHGTEVTAGAQPSLRMPHARHELTRLGVPIEEQHGAHSTALVQNRQIPYLSSSAGLSTSSIAPSANGSDAKYRISSMTSIDASLHRQLPGYRMVSPHLEWKSASSVAHHAGLASASFANAQFNGTDHQRPAEVHDNRTTQHHGRFKECSIDGMTSPPPSSPPMSPRMTPKGSPTKNGLGKGPSPARHKFEHIAGMVGIKTGKDGNEPGSPPNKRRWRDVWRGGRKDGNEGDLA